MGYCREVVDQGNPLGFFGCSEGADVRWFEDDVGVESFYEFWNCNKSSVAFRGGADSVVVEGAEERVFGFVNKCIPVVFVRFQKRFCQILCVYVYACFLCVDGVRQNCYVHIFTLQMGFYVFRYPVVVYNWSLECIGTSLHIFLFPNS